MGLSSLTAGDFVFLGLLARGPMSPYDIKREMSGSVSFFWSAAHSQIYQQTTRLLRDGYISERSGRGRRNRRVLSITSKGRNAVKQWLTEPAPLYRTYDESLAKVFLGALGDRDALLAMLDDQAEQHRNLLTTFEELETALAGVDYGDDPPFELFTLRLGLGVERAWLRWLAATTEELRVRSDA